MRVYPPSMGAQWSRTHEAYGVRDALADVASGIPWAIRWCGGQVSRSSDTDVDSEGLEHVKHKLVEPAKQERLRRKSNRRSKTVIMAERWVHDVDGPFVLFYESGPYLLPDRETPTS